MLPIEGRTSISSKKRFKCAVGLSNGLLVEDFPVTLISPKAMFANEGIRTYFNDDIFFRTPGGMFFDFIETETLYVLPFLNESFLLEPTAEPSRIVEPYHATADPAGPGDCQRQYQTVAVCRPPVRHRS